MHFGAVLHEAGVRTHTYLQRRVDRIGVDIGDKSVNGRVDAGWRWSEEIAARRLYARQRLYVCDTSFIDGSGLVAANSLVIISLEIVFLRGRKRLKENR